ncbi:MAG: glycosyltransferase [Bradymonadia bacterium]
MKIALVGPTHPFRGGISHYNTLLYQHLKAHSPETRFYAFWRQYPQWLFPGQSDRDPSAEALTADGVEHVLDGCNPATFARLGWRLRRDRPDLLVLPWWVVFWAPHYLTLLSIARPRRTVFLVHNAHEHEDHWAKRRVTREVLARGDGFLCHTREDEAKLGAMKLGGPIARAFHPTYEDIAPGAPRAEARRRLRETFDDGLDPSDPVILFFGFVRPYKGLEDLLIALAKADTPARLWVVGEFWQGGRATIDAQISTIGLGDRVRIMDRYVANEEIGDYFSAADVVALPYRSGTGSGVLQLAFGHRRPVIATAVGSQADAVRHGATGLLVPPEAPEALAGAIDQFFRDEDNVPYDRHIDEDVKGRFSWTALVDALVSVAHDGH